MWSVYDGCHTRTKMYVVLNFLRKIWVEQLGAASPSKFEERGRGGRFGPRDPESNFEQNKHLCEKGQVELM